jgi:hypothetical protein
VLQTSPEVYQETVERWIGEYPSVEVLRGYLLTGTVEDSGLIASIEIRNGTPSRRVPVRSVVDATGNAEAARLSASGRIRQGAVGVLCGQIFRLRGVSPGAAEFPANVGLSRRLRQHWGGRGAACPSVWFDTGTREDEVYVKVSLPPASEERADLPREVRRRLPALLRRLPGFSRAEVTRTGEAARRDGAAVVGDYTLTREDVLGCGTFPDAAARCAWPIELWDAEAGLRIEYLPEGGHYEIPARALKVCGIRNLWAAGRCISADADVQASARVIGCCWATGEAAGAAAARACGGYS